MSELKDIVTELELSKQMKEKGFPQKGLFSWYFTRIANYQLWKTIDNKSDWTDEDHEWLTFANIFCLAPTAEEILKELPKSIYGESPIRISNFDDGYGVEYINTAEFFFHDKKLCNALGKMYNYLKAKGSIK